MPFAILQLVEGESAWIAQGKKEKEKESTHNEQDENMEDWRISLRRLQLMRSIPSTFFDLEKRATLGNLRRYGMDRNNQKGGIAMNNSVYFAHGLILGAILAAWVAFMLRK